MEETFTMPPRPWGEPEVKYLAAHAHLLDEETKAELGFVKPEPIDDFKADLDAPVDAGPSPVVETGTIEPVGVVTVEGEPVTPEDIAAGLEAFNELSAEDQEAARAAAQAEDVDNEGTDNA